MEHKTWEQMDACRTHLLKHLAEVMTQRRHFAGIDWIDYERCMLTKFANIWAEDHNLNQIQLSQVEYVESLAVGHVDYASKLALYVAELIYEQRKTSQ